MSNIQLRAYFTGKTFCNGEELNELLISIPLISLGNIGHYRYTGPTDLIPQDKILRKVTYTRYGIDLVNQLPCFLPGIDVFETPDCGHLLSLYPHETPNFELET